MKYLSVAITVWIMMGIAGTKMLAEYGNKRPMHLVSTSFLVVSGPVVLGVGIITFLMKSDLNLNPCLANCVEK